MVHLYQLTLWFKNLPRPPISLKEKSTIPSWTHRSVLLPITSLPLSLHRPSHPHLPAAPSAALATPSHSHFLPPTLCIFPSCGSHDAQADHEVLGSSYCLVWLAVTTGLPHQGLVLLIFQVCGWSLEPSACWADSPPQKFVYTPVLF